MEAMHHAADLHTAFRTLRGLQSEVSGKISRVSKVKMGRTERAARVSGHDFTDIAVEPGMDFRLGLGLWTCFQILIDFVHGVPPEGLL
jgi:hypothetical protein